MNQSISKIIFLGLITVLAACGDTKQSSDSNSTVVGDGLIKVTETQFKSNGMQLGTLEEKQFPETISVNGSIDVPPENRAVVSATMGGYIKTTPLLQGDVVKKGQILVTIENPEFVALQQEYMEVHQQLSYLKADYNRHQTMQDENITSEKSFLKAESMYKSAVAKHTGLSKQLQLLNISPSHVEKGNMSAVATIYAPISGSISKVNVTRGTYVSPASPILEIIDNEHIHLELSVFEKDIMKIKKGQKIDFKIPEASDSNFKAEVYLVGAAMEENRTIKVHGHLMNESENNFLTGMFVEAEIITSSIDKMALPNEAIVTVEGTPHVLILEKHDGNTYYFRSHKIKQSTTGTNYSVIEITSKLNLETQFLVKGAFGLLGI